MVSLRESREGFDLVRLAPRAVFLAALHLLDRGVCADVRHLGEEEQTRWIRGAELIRHVVVVG